MSVRLKWGHIAQLGEDDTNGIGLTRIFDFLRVSERKPKARLPIPCYLGAMFEADASDGGVHSLHVTLVDSKGKQRCDDPAEKVLLFQEAGATHFLAGAFLEVGGWELPRPDLYQFVFSVNGRKVGSIPIAVRTIERLAHPIEPVPNPSVRLRWGHVVDAVVGDEEGTISLEGITDAITLPPFLDGLVTPTLKLAFSVEAHPAAGVHHNFRVTLTNPREETIAAHEGSLHLNLLAPNLPLCAADVVTFTEVPLIGIGDYIFHIQVDDKTIGKVPLWMVHPVPVGAGDAV